MTHEEKRAKALVGFMKKNGKMSVSALVADGFYSGYDAATEQLQAENARLREALESINNALEKGHPIIALSRTKKALEQ